MNESTAPSFRTQIDSIVERLRQTFPEVHARVGMEPDGSVCAITLSQGDRAMLLLGMLDESGSAAFGGPLQERRANVGLIGYLKTESEVTAIARAWFIDRRSALEMRLAAGTLPFPS